jgi:hypothetical protein
LIVVKKPEPPETLEVKFIAPGGKIVGSQIIEIAKPALTPTRVYDHQCWSEAVAFDEFVAAIREPDGQGLSAAMKAFDRLQCWNAIWVRLSHLDADERFRESFRSRTAEFGYRFRQSVRDLRVVIAAFRHLLPPYSGPSLHLYRGELASKHEARDYGFSWTTSVKVARMFTDRRIAVDNEPGILLETVAPVEAIISGPAPTSPNREDEHIVDPGELKGIRVIE